MKNLFLIDGASGTGKSLLLQHIVEFGSEEACLKKFTTRPEREYEKAGEVILDLVFVNDTVFEAKALDYVYTYNGHHYGFSKHELDQLLKTRENVFVIVRNENIIRRICREYSFINVVPIYIYTDQPKLKRRLMNQHRDPTFIAGQIKRLNVTYRDYRNHPEIYREIIINN